MRLRTVCVSLLSFSFIRTSRASDPSKESSFPYNEFERWETEPFIRSVHMKVVAVQDEKSPIQPGYIFLGPLPRAGSDLFGPQIFTQDGELIWYGNSSTTSLVENFSTCRYLGDEADHLCWCEFDFKTLQGVRGRNRIFDNAYNQVGRDYGEAGELRFPNPHEFLVLPGGKSFLQSVYQLRKVDLTEYMGPNPGYIEDGCFQEIDIVTGQSLFEWCGLDHLELWHTNVFLDIANNNPNYTGEPYGVGTFEQAWDYFHLNSVDKTAAGDYIISARHLDEIMKVAGINNTEGYKPGEIIWRLGGRVNSFKGAFEVDLSKQHHVRIVNESESGLVISFFNNQWRAHAEHSRTTNAQILVLDEKEHIVREVRKFHQPEGWRAFAQGSTQVFDNGNVFVGWGTIPQATEFSADGTILQHFHFSPYNLTGGRMIDINMQNYRTFKLDWVGKPKTSPKLVSYSFGCQPNNEAPLTAYVSWNGATEVKHWRFSTSRWSSLGPWTSAGFHRKTGFETRVNLTDYFGSPSSFRRYVKAEAIDVNGNVLGRVISRTYVPNERVSQNCDENACYVPASELYHENTNNADSCHPPSDLIGMSSVLAIIALSLPVCLLFRHWRRRHAHRAVNIAVLEKQEIGRYHDDFK